MRRRTLILGAVASVAVAGALALLSPVDEAEASFTSDSVKELTAYLQGGHALNLKLMALDALRQKSDTGVESAIETIAKGKDARLAVYATTQLGKKGTETARTKLKGLVMNSGLKSAVRKSAMTAIALSWKASADLSWLKENTASDAALKGHCSWLETNVFGK